jgi:hypothetical protein
MLDIATPESTRWDLWQPSGDARTSSLAEPVPSSKVILPLSKTPNPIRRPFAEVSRSALSGRQTHGCSRNDTDSWIASS